MLAKRILFKGIITSNKLSTVSIFIKNISKHSLYKKILIRKKKYIIHNKFRDLKLKDRVSCILIKPISNKKYSLILKKTL